MPYFDELIGEIEEGGNDLALCRKIATYLFGDTLQTERVARALGGDLHASIGLFDEVLPGWVYKIARCHISDDVWATPDFNDPRHTERLDAIIGPVARNSTWDWGIDLELRPPRGAYPGAALLCATITGRAGMLDPELLHQPKAWPPSHGSADGSEPGAEQGAADA